jgi:DNA replicative helicase MCM subunit Mcm2 (Cdc46/Mcm family)
MFFIPYFQLPTSNYKFNMSDVAAIQELVQRQKALKQEIAKVIVGQDEVVHQILLSIFSGGHALLSWCSRISKNFNGKYHFSSFRVGF